MYSKIVFAISMIIFCSLLNAAPKKVDSTNTLIEISNEKEASLYIQKSIDEIINASQYKVKVQKLDVLYKTSQKQSKIYTAELTQLYIEKEKVEQDLKNRTTDLQMDSYSKLKTKIDIKQNILEQWNNVYVEFKPLFNLFVKNKKTNDLNCDVISHKIYFDNNGNKPDGSKLPPFAQLTQKVALDLCDTQSVTK